MNTPLEWPDFGAALMQQADALAAFSEAPGQITRVYLSPEHRLAADYLIKTMHTAGLQAGLDALGNVVGRYAALDPNAPTVMIGSHLDSVRNAGRYDGLFGILSPVAALGYLHSLGQRLPFHVEVVGFGDEEGVRFGVTLIGSKAMAGKFDVGWLEQRDAAGVSMREALINFGLPGDGWASLDRRGKLMAYLESHIEQGPVLLNEGLALGVVTAISGASRVRVTVEGLAGHAGTVPMGSRQDALAAASEMVLAVEAQASAQPNLVGTVGTLQLKPGAVNVIPQTVVFTIDVRSGEDALREQLVDNLREGFGEIAKRRNVKLIYDVFYAASAAPCDPRLQQQLAQSLEALGQPVRHLPSGAGHDAMAFAGVCPQAMLFVRCGNNGISHHPDETMTAADADLATRALLHTLLNMPLLQSQ